MKFNPASINPYLQLLSLFAIDYIIFAYIVIVYKCFLEEFIDEKH
jgi:hypothetical protein